MSEVWRRKLCSRHCILHQPPSWPVEAVPQNCDREGRSGGQVWKFFFFKRKDTLKIKPQKTACHGSVLEDIRTTGYQTDTSTLYREVKLSDATMWYCAKEQELMSSRICNKTVYSHMKTGYSLPETYTGRWDSVFIMNCSLWLFSKLHSGHHIGH